MKVFNTKVVRTYLVWNLALQIQKLPHIVLSGYVTTKLFMYIYIIEIKLV